VAKPAADACTLRCWTMRSAICSRGFARKHVLCQFPSGNLVANW
jgi:hypothetical protein